MCEPFNPCPAVDEAVRVGLNLVGGYARGDVVPWATLEAAVGFVRYTEHWGAFLHRMRRDFRNVTGIVLWPVRDVGLELLTINDQLHKRSIARHRRAVKQLTKELRELDALPDGELTQHQQEVKARKLMKARDERRAVLRGLREGHSLLRPSKTGVPWGRPW